MNDKFLLLLDGMTGSGKTSVTKLLAERLPRTAIIGMDKVKRFVTDFERGKRDNQIAKAVIFEMAKKYLELGLSVIVDQPLKDEEIFQYGKLAEDLSVKCYKIQLYSSSEVSFNRVKERQKNLVNKVPEDRILKNISFFKDRSHLGFFVIDTSNLSIEKVSNLILKEIMGK